MKKEDIKVYTDLVKELSAIMQESNLTKLKFKHDSEGDSKLNDKFTIELENSHNDATITTVTPTIHASAIPHANVSHIPQPVADATATTAETDYTKHDGIILAPMVGVIYNAPNPESSPFVEVGSEVSVGDTLLLIEAMKVFNPIKAHKAGKVTKIFVKNNSPVEFNEPLILIE